MQCPRCNKEYKTHEGYMRHLREEISDFQHGRLGFWGEYNAACENGYLGSPDEYAEERVTGHRRDDKWKPRIGT